MKALIDPGPRHHPGAVARADAGLVGIDQRIERGGVDVAFLSEHAFEGAHAQVHFAEFAVIMGMVVGVVMAGHRPMLAPPRKIPNMTSSTRPVRSQYEDFMRHVDTH